MAITVSKEAPPHVMLLPFPAQGHINPFMELAHLLSQNNVMVTFVNTEINHDKLLPHLDTAEQRIRFLSFPDGLPKDHGRLHDLIEYGKALATNMPPHIGKIIEDTLSSDDGNEIPPISAIIADGMISFVQNVADKYAIPRISFSTNSACGLAAFNTIPILRDNGVIPAPENEELHKEWMSNLVGCLPAMETLRGKDLPSFFRTKDPSDLLLKWIESESANADSAELILLNTWEDLEGPVLIQLNKQFNNKVLAIGPLAIYAENMSMKTSLWEEEGSCLAWLDGQSPRSVIYVGFGSVALLSETQLSEFAAGLENCGQPFLWVIRPDLVRGQTSSTVWDGFKQRCKDRACLVSWAPQRKVLSHPAVAGFLTHCGWNSTMESISAGVPLLCWPSFGDQQTNKRFVSSVWNAGLELREDIRGEEVVQGVKRIMECYADENNNDNNVAVHAREHREKALLSTCEGGASHGDFMRLVDKLRRASPARLPKD